jgi:beta-galactosidase
MKQLLTLLACVIVLCSCSNLKEQDVSKILFDFDWKFALNEQPGAEKADFDDSNWRNLDLPHDFSIEQPFDSLNQSGQGGGYAFGGIGWYRKHFVLSESTEGKRVVIQFNGIYRNSEVWINGHFLGKRPYGYSTFSYDLSDFLNKSGKENVIAVKVNTSDQPNSRWYSGAGIYRHVWLKKSGMTYFPEGGVFVRTGGISCFVRSAER